MSARIDITDNSRQAIALVEYRKAWRDNSASVNITFCDTEELVAISKYQVTVREV